MPLRITLYLLLLLTLPFFSRCGDDDDNGSTTDDRAGALVRFDAVAEITPDLIAALAASNPELFTGTISPTPATFYRVEYRTPDPAGSLITASGLVGVPNGVTSAPVASLQPGTVLRADRVPSRSSRLDDIDPGLLLFAGTGMIAVAPDYIGYGASAPLPHPYQHAATLGSSCYDLLLAARELAASLEVTVEDELYLTGYSLGGDATVALHRHIEQNSDWTVTLSAPGGGAYDKVAVARSIAAETNRVFLAPLYLWITQTYDEIYGLGRPWSDYVTPTNAALLTQPIDEGATWLNLGLERVPADLLSPAFRAGVLDGTDRAYLDALEDNDLTNWSPRFPLTFYHGTEDKDVPIVGARSAFERLSAANPAVTLIELPGADHVSAAEESNLLILEQITLLRQ